MNKLSTGERKQIVAALVEGNSMRAGARIMDVSRNTIDKLLRDLGSACSEYQDEEFRNLSCKRIQCDEIWSFVGAKEKNCTREMKAKGAGDIWTWVALDPDSKLVPCWFIGQRHAGCAYHFLSDFRSVCRIALRAWATVGKDAHAQGFHPRDGFVTRLAVRNGARNLGDFSNPTSVGLLLQSRR